MRNGSASAKVMRRALLWSTALAFAVAFGGATVGMIAAGQPGANGAFAGAGMAFAFLAITTVSVRIGAHFPPTAFFAIVVGSWIAKMAIFLALVLLLGRSAAIDGTVLFVCLVIVMVGTLVIDVVSFLTGRIPYGEDTSHLSKKDR